MESKALLETCVALLKEKKAQEILSLDIRELSVVADYFLLATAGNNRQAQALADHLREETKKLAISPLRVNGYQEGRWVLLDYASVIVHIFLPEERQYYNLERLWGDAPQQAY